MQITTEQLIAVLNNIGAQFIVTDPETNIIIYANDKVREAYKDFGNLLGIKCYQIYGIDCRCDFCPVPKLLENPTETVEWESYNPSLGQWIKNVSSLVPWPDGRLVHLQQCVDITEIKQMSESLAKRLKQQELMSEITQNFISDDDLRTLIISALRKSGEFLGVERVTVSTIWDHSADDFRCSWNVSGEMDSTQLLSATLKLKMAEQWKSSNLPYFTDKIIEKTSLAKTVKEKGLQSFLAIPIYLDNELWGALSYEMWTQSREWTESDIALGRTITGVIGGVLERARIQSIAHEAEERARAMMDAMPLACTMFDRNLKPVACNEEAVRMFGLQDKQAYLDSFNSISPQFQPDGQDSAQKAGAVISETFQSGYKVVEWVHSHIDGEPVIPMEVILIRMKWRGEDHVVSFARDLRELKAKLTEIEKTQNELRCAKERAEESARAKTNFLANMSHEIRTPMNAIVGMTELAKNSNDMERIKYCLDRLDDASNHLIGVINDILDMSKIEAGRLELTPSDFLLEKMLQRVSNVTIFRAEQKTQEFIIRIEPSVPSAIVADQQRLAQVVTNLLSNAVKFTPEDGKICLTVTNVEETEETCTLLFEVIDNGIGISQEQQSKLFQMFEQADGSISRRFGGTGLGLSISKSIVDAMGGHIGVESKQQEGARFFFTITVPKGTASYQSRLNPEINWDNIRILVVDDAPEVREYFEDIMSAIGLTCKTAPDGYEAFRLIEQEKDFHIMFVDWMMPGMDGIALAQKIRARFGDSVMVIMISSADWDQIKDHAAGTGIDHFIGKPLFPSSIIDCMNKCLGQRQIHSELAERSDEDIFHGKRILLAEDIEINQEILIALLEPTGMEIICANNGREAIDTFVKDPASFDMILMDIHMPEVDGYQATKAIRSLNSQKALEIPIVAMTANVFREDIDRCLAAGMDDHIGKPVNKEEMIAKIRRYL